MPRAFPFPEGMDAWTNPPVLLSIVLRGQDL